MIHICWKCDCREREENLRERVIVLEGQARRAFDAIGALAHKSGYTLERVEAQEAKWELVPRSDWPPAPKEPTA